MEQWGGSDFRGVVRMVIMETRSEGVSRGTAGEQSEVSTNIEKVMGPAGTQGLWSERRRWVWGG